MQLLTIDRLQLGITQIHFGLLVVECTYKYGGMVVVCARMVCTSTCTLIDSALCIVPIRRRYILQTKMLWLMCTIILVAGREWEEAGPVETGFGKREGKIHFQSTPESIGSSAQPKWALKSSITHVRPTHGIFDHFDKINIKKIIIFGSQSQKPQFGNCDFI